MILAGVEARRQELGRSRDLLTDSALNAVNGDDFVIQLSYYQTYGELQWKNGQIAEAEKALQSALRICDLWLAHLRDSNDRLAWRTLTGNVYRDLVDLYSTSDSQPDRAFKLWQQYRGLTEREHREIGTSGREGQVQADMSGGRSAADDSALEIVQTFHDRSLLTLVQFRDGLGLWFADDRGLSFHKVKVDPLVLERKIRHFRMLCAQRDSNPSAIQATGKELFSLLLSPISKSIETRRTLLVDADSSLRNLPFPALVNEKGEYLVQVTPITMSPGLEFERALGHRSESRLFQQNALILAPSVPPALANTLLPLKDAIKEAKSVAAKFPKHTLLLGSDATRSAFEVAVFRTAAIHFAGHAIFKNGQIGLVLAGQGRNRVQVDGTDLYASDSVKKGVSSDLRLVVLAACSTADSSDNDLHLRGSLVEAFLQARVAHVVAAQWDIDSATTQVLMEKFYSDLAAGKSVAEALQGAQALVSSKSSTSHPYYWASFEAAGGS